jgi:hypothetical protein
MFRHPIFLLRATQPDKHKPRAGSIHARYRRNTQLTASSRSSSRCFDLA